jgi:hypothetical protein
VADGGGIFRTMAKDGNLPTFLWACARLKLTAPPELGHEMASAVQSAGLTHWPPSALATALWSCALLRVQNPEFLEPVVEQATLQLCRAGDNHALAGTRSPGLETFIDHVLCDHATALKAVPILAGLGTPLPPGSKLHVRLCSSSASSANHGLAWDAPPLREQVVFETLQELSKQHHSWLGLEKHPRPLSGSKLCVKPAAGLQAEPIGFAWNPYPQGASCVLHLAAALQANPNHGLTLELLPSKTYGGSAGLPLKSRLFKRANTRMMPV